MISPRFLPWLLPLALTLVSGCVPAQWQAYWDAAVEAQQQGRLAAAEDLSLAALREAEKLGRQNPLLGVNLLHLGKINRMQGKYSEAERMLKQSLPIMEKVYPAQPPLAGTQAELGIVYDFQANYPLAEFFYGRALAIYQKTLGLGHPQAAEVLDNVRSLYRDQGKYPEAVRVAEIWIPILLKDEVQEKMPRVVSDGFVQTGELYVAQGRYAQAEELLKRAVTLRERVHGSGHPVVVTTMNYLSFIYRAQAKHNEAEAIARQALTTSEKVLGPDHPSVAQSLSALAAVYEAQGKYTDAETLYKRALEIWQKAFGEDDLQVAQGLGDYSRLLRKMNRDAVAEKSDSLAKAIRAKHAGAKPDKWPIEVKDGPCRIWVLPSTPYRLNFLTHGLGFEPNEEIEMVGRSNGELIQLKLKVSSDGSLSFVIPVGVLGERTGSVGQTFTAKLCKLRVHHEWGRVIAQTK